MFHSIFVNMSIENLQRSMDFFSGLGFSFNPQFKDEQGTCMVISEHIYVMLVEKAKYQTFTKKKIAERDTIEMALSFPCESPAEVRRLSELAFSLGATKLEEPTDLGFMYSWGFEDLDGHAWDLFWMDPAHLES